MELQDLNDKDKQVNPNLMLMERVVSLHNFLVTFILLFMGSNYKVAQINLHHSRPASAVLVRGWLEVILTLHQFLIWDP